MAVEPSNAKRKRPIQLQNFEYNVAWITALPHESAAAEAMLDNKHAPALSRHQKDSNTYTLGSINGPNGEHKVVIASLPYGRYGTISATTVASQMLSTFPQIKFCLMVGIGGGIPSESNDIRLGDVVVSKPEGSFGGVRQYDIGKTTTRGSQECGALNSPPAVLLNAIGAVETEHQLRDSAIPEILESMYQRYPLMANPRRGPGFCYQGAHNDRLFHSDYVHLDGKRDCSECDVSKQVIRPERSDPYPHIYYGTIASGNQIIKDAVKRDCFAETCLCFETESAGLMNNFPCLVIRGISDYSDSHKNDRWQKYAAATAAAYAKELLRLTDVEDTKNSKLALEVINEIQVNLRKINSGVEEVKTLKNRKEILEWLSPLLPSARHFENQEKRVNGTGVWLLNEESFVRWSSNSAMSQVLICYGDPGAGKTILSSLIIDELQNDSKSDSKLGVAYMYCDYRDTQMQTTENILGSLSKQLLERLQNIPSEVIEICGKSISDKLPPNLKKASSIFRVICKEFNKVRRSLYPALLYCTGRPHIRTTVEKYFLEPYMMWITAQAEDIMRYIEAEIGGKDDIEPDAMSEELKDKIKKKIVDSAQGVFLLPTLHLRSVLQNATMRERESSLETLPPNISEAFAGSLLRVRQQARTLSERAEAIIAWVYLSYEPLTLDQLRCSTAIKDNDTSFDPRGLPIRDTFLTCCHGLVVIDKETATVRLVHFSFQEYLSQQDQMFGLKEAYWHVKISKTCLKCLMLEPLKVKKAKMPQLVFEVDPALLEYAARYWGHHLRDSKEFSGKVLQLAQVFLTSGWETNTRGWWSLRSSMYGEHIGYYPKATFSPMHVVAFFGIKELLESFLIKGIEVDSKDGIGWTALCWATHAGSEPAVRLLVENGANIDYITPRGWTPLIIAMKRKHLPLVKYFIFCRAAIDVPPNQAPIPAGLSDQAILKLLQTRVARSASAASMDIFFPV